MKRRANPIIIGIATLAVLALVAFWFFQRKESKPVRSVQAPTPIPAPTAAATPIQPISTQPRIALTNLPDTEAQKTVEELYSTPVLFYGKVVDEGGKPIAGAHAKLMVDNVQWSSGKRFDRVTDAAGLFDLTDTQGAAVAVDVDKEGYASTEKSRGMFRLGKLRTNDDPKPPAPNEPAIFVLQSLGKVEPLVRVGTFVKVARNGQPTELDLSTGKSVAIGQGNFRVEAWTNDQTKDERGHYDWRCKISIPNGGLIERKDLSVFEAPAEGYKASDEINMPKDATPWQSRVRRQYFLKLANGRYARVQFEMVAQGDNFFSIKSYLNPNAASRNLATSSTTGN